MAQDAHVGVESGRRDTTGLLVPRADCYLQPEQVFVSDTPRTIMTILGSCVSVCLWDGKLGVGGMNHFLLPHDSAEPGFHRGRFGRHAFQLLMEQMALLGCRKEDLQAKVFGGARIHAPAGGRALSLGRQNVDLALSLLRGEGIPIGAQDVGGTLGRKLLFRTSDGAAWIKAIGGR